MKLLFNANLSWRLKKILADYYPDCIHVEDTGLSIPAKDIEIWEYAKKNNYIIVTNDEDFYNLLVIKGFPPKLIFLRTGNQSTHNIANILIKHKEEINKLINSDDTGLLEIF